MNELSEILHSIQSYADDYNLHFFKAITVRTTRKINSQGDATKCLTFDLNLRASCPKS